MTELTTVQTGVAAPLNTIPANSLALLQQLGAIDGEVTEYSGHGIHNSKQALVRKVAGLVRLLL